MNNLVEIKPSDLFIQCTPPKNIGGWSIGNSTGVIVYHKPTGIEVEMDSERSQHKNKDAAITILKDLLTEFKVGDIILTENGLGEINSLGCDEDGAFCVYTLDDKSGRCKSLLKVAHTEEGYRYKNEKVIVEQIEALQDDYNSEVEILRCKLSDLKEVKF